MANYLFAMSYEAVKAWTHAQAHHCSKDEDVKNGNVAWSKVRLQRGQEHKPWKDANDNKEDETKQVGPDVH